MLCIRFSPVAETWIFRSVVRGSLSEWQRNTNLNGGGPETSFKVLAQKIIIEFWMNLTIGTDKNQLCWLTNWGSGVSKGWGLQGTYAWRSDRKKTWKMLILDSPIWQKPYEWMTNVKIPCVFDLVSMANDNQDRLTVTVTVAWNLFELQTRSW